MLHSVSKNWKCQVSSIYKYVAQKEKKHLKNYTTSKTGLNIFKISMFIETHIYILYIYLYKYIFISFNYGMVQVLNNKLFFFIII